MLFVRTCAGSATPCSSQVAWAPAVKPEPMTWTSTVVPRSPKLGFVDVTAGPAGALAAAGAVGATSGPSTEGAEHAARSSATRAKRRGWRAEVIVG